jgi:hypothetical protein
MRNFHSSIPTFGKFAALLNEKVRPEVATMNEWHFKNFFKKCLIQSGFISIIRYNYDNTLYLKLYFFDNKVRDNRREMEMFVTSYYLHEKYELKYEQCNIISIPIKIQVDDEIIQKQNDIPSLESLLQLQLNEESWISVDYTGTSGGLTIGVNPEYQTHKHRKSLLEEGYIKPDYVEKINKWLERKDTTKTSVRTRIKRESDGLNVSISTDKIVLSWSSVPLEVQVSYSIQFIWKGIHIKLTVLEYYGQRSNTIRAIVKYLEKTYNFGFGRSSVGAGSMGEHPNIVVGNNKLKFEFGKNCMSISELINDQRLELMEDKKESSFELVL